MINIAHRFSYHKEVSMSRATASQNRIEKIQHYGIRSLAGDLEYFLLISEERKLTPQEQHELQELMETFTSLFLPTSPDSNRRRAFRIPTEFQARVWLNDRTYIVPAKNLSPYGVALKLPKSFIPVSHIAVDILIVGGKYFYTNLVGHVCWREISREGSLYPVEMGLVFNSLSSTHTNLLADVTRALLLHFLDVLARMSDDEFPHSPRPKNALAA